MTSETRGDLGAYRKKHGAIDVVTIPVHRNGGNSILTCKVCTWKSVYNLLFKANFQEKIMYFNSILLTITLAMTLRLLLHPDWKKTLVLPYIYARAGMDVWGGLAPWSIIQWKSVHCSDSRKEVFLPVTVQLDRHEQVLKLSSSYFFTHKMLIINLFNKH